MLVIAINIICLALFSHTTSTCCPHSSINFGFGFWLGGEFLGFCPRDDYLNLIQFLVHVALVASASFSFSSCLLMLMFLSLNFVLASISLLVLFFLIASQVSRFLVHRYLKHRPCLADFVSLFYGDEKLDHLNLMTLLHSAFPFFINNQFAK